MELITHDPIIHEICSYLDISDIIKLRRVSKHFHHKLSRTRVYTSVIQCKKVKLDHNKILSIKSDNIEYKSKYSKYVIKGLASLFLLLALPIVIPIGIVTLPCTVPSIYRCIKKGIISKVNKIKYSFKHRNILSLYHKSLTHESYFMITKHLIDNHPDVLSDINVVDQLKICIIYNNIKALDFILDNYHIYNISVLPIDCIIYFDRLDIWMSIEKYYKVDIQFLNEYLNEYLNDKVLPYIPNLLRYMVENEYTNYDFETICRKSCSRGLISMVEYLIQNNLVDVENNKHIYLKAARKHKQKECLIYLCELFNVSVQELELGVYNPID